MNAISQKLFDEVQAVLNARDIQVLKVSPRGEALSCETLTVTEWCSEYDEPYLFIGPSSATRYEPVEARLFNRNVREIVERLKDVTIDFRVAIFENALPSRRHSYTLEIVLGYRANMLSALCFNLDHDDSRNWDVPVVEALLKETHK